jgi:hypothetical protein
MFHWEFCSQYKSPEDEAEVAVKNTINPLFNKLLGD